MNLEKIKETAQEVKEATPEGVHLLHSQSAAFSYHEVPELHFVLQCFHHRGKHLPA